MKIAIDAREWSTSTGRYISSLVRELEKLESGHEFTVLLYPKDMDRYQPASPRFTKIVCPHKEFSFDEQLGFKRQLDQLHADLVHFAMVQQPVWYKGKVVTTMNDLTTVRFKNPSKNPLVFAAKQQVYKWVNKRVAKKSAALLTFTEYVKNDVVNYTGVSPEKITVTPLAADVIQNVAEPVAELEGAQFIMYVGRPLPHKNLPALIEAFKLLKASHPNLKLVLGGKKDVLYEQIEQVVTAQGTPDVIFSGFVSEGQLRWLYENCAAYVIPSLSEGFGLPGLEAMAHGAPVVSSNATCLPEVYGEAAHYFDPVNLEDIAQRIGEVIDNPELRQSLIDNGRSQVARYSWQRAAQETLAVYNQLLAG